MYRCLCDYNSGEQDVLSIKAGEQFMFIDQHDLHWWKMQAENGVVGLVPASYVVPDEEEMEHPTAQKAVLESVERAMELIHDQAAQNAGSYTSEQRANLRKLLERRKVILSRSSSAKRTPNVSPSISINDMGSCTSVPRRPAPAPPGRQPSLEALPAQPRRSAPALPGDLSRKSSKRQAPPVPTQSPPSIASLNLSPEEHQEVPVPARFAPELIERLRINTGISYDLSFVAAETVISHIRNRIPSTASVMDKILKDIMDEKGNALHSDESLITSHDGRQLEEILNALTEHKDDAQQRSWALDMDEPTITQQLKDLLKLLADASPSTSRAVVKQNDYEYVQSLVVYYQMEHRTPLRLLLLEVFGCLCGVDRDVISQLLYSVLPGELSRAIQSCEDDLQLQLCSSLVLTMMFSTAEPVPYWLYDQLDTKFVKYLVTSIESAPDGEDGDKLVDSFVRLMLAFNLHFIDPKTNILMQVLADQSITKTVSEQIMLLVNRGEDPVDMFDYPRSCSHSVLKFLADLFASSKTSSLFFTSDMKVLIEIILRQLSDLAPGETVRTEYLVLLRLILTNSDYDSHRHLCSDLRFCLKRISEEEGSESKQDKTITQELLAQFSNYFG